MARTVDTGWRRVTPGACDFCGCDEDWLVDGRGGVYCTCQTCSDCEEPWGEHLATCAGLKREPPEDPPGG